MDVRISRSLLSTYWTLALVLTGVMSPLLGKLYDAAGARVMLAAAGALAPAPTLRSLTLAQARFSLSPSH